MTFSGSRLASHPPYDYGFFGDHPTTPTKYFVVDGNGKTIARNIAVTDITFTIQSYLASGKSYYFGPTLFTIIPYQEISMGATVTILTGLDLTGLSDITFSAHPKAVLKMTDGTYPDIGTNRVNIAFLTNGGSRIQFRDIYFDGNIAGITGSASQGMLFVDNNAGYGCVVDRCHFVNCCYALYGDPREAKSGTFHPDADYGYSITDCIFDACEGAAAIHNGPGGNVIRGNLFRNCTRLPALFLDSSHSCVVSDNIFRNCLIPISCFDGQSLCDIHDNIFEEQYENTASYAIKIVRGGTLENDKQPCENIKVHSNIFYGFQTVIQSDSYENIECYDNTYLQGSAAALVPYADGPDGTRTISSRNNVGFIAPGERRSITVDVTELAQNGITSVDNPFGQNVYVESVDFIVTTVATATEPNIDIGIGNNAATSYANLFSEIPGETLGWSKSTVNTPGAHVLPQLWKSGGGPRYLNIAITDAAATGMVARAIINVIGYSDDILVSIPEFLVGDDSFEGSTAFGTSDRICAQKWTAGYSGVVEQLRAAISTTCPSVGMALYADDAGSPGALLGITERKACEAGTISFTMTATVPVSAETAYWIAIKTQVTGGMRGTYVLGAAVTLSVAHSADFPDPLAGTGAYNFDIDLAAFGTRL
jgi:hypothetical protein